MMRPLLSSLVFACAAGGFAAAPVISLKTFSPDAAARQAVITYTLTGANAIVTMDVLTNGVSIGARHCRAVWGDVNREIAADEEVVRTLHWSYAAGFDGMKVTDRTLSVKLTAHPLSDPPRYVAICAAEPATPKYYYTSEDALPEDVTASRWKTDWILMRRIDAAGVPWRMGSPGYEAGREVTDASPRLVTLSEDYYIGVYPVTQRQWALLYTALAVGGASAAPSVWKGWPDSDLRPVESLSWANLRGDGGNMPSGTGTVASDFDVTDKPYHWPTKGHAVDPACFLGKMRARFNRAFDLPTEAQWEYACRAGSGGATYDAQADLDELAWTSGNSAVVEGDEAVCQTHPVGLKKPNAFGLYDMLGNVQEWVLDFMPKRESSVFYNGNEPLLDPAGVSVRSDTLDTRLYRMRKGGSFQDDASSCRSAARNQPHWSQNANNQIAGFRLCAPIGPIE